MPTCSNSSHKAEGIYFEAILHHCFPPGFSPLLIAPGPSKSFSAPLIIFFLSPFSGLIPAGIPHITSSIDFHHLIIPHDLATLTFLEQLMGLIDMHPLHTQPKDMPKRWGSKCHWNWWLQFYRIPHCPWCHSTGHFMWTVKTIFFHGFNYELAGLCTLAMSCFLNPLMWLFYWYFYFSIFVFSTYQLLWGTANRKARYSFVLFFKRVNKITTSSIYMHDEGCLSHSSSS